MNVGEDLKPKFNIFSAVPENQRRVPVSSMYFLTLSSCHKDLAEQRLPENGMKC